MNSIHFLNPFKEGQKPELEEICMQSLLLVNQRMVQEGILHLEISEK
jgi:hypothetical protein